jgi:ribonuclease J
LTSLTFYGGVNEIGGNKILLEDKDTKVFLDFGKSFSRREKYFEEYLKPRQSNGIVDLLTTGLVPDIEGIYRDDLMEKAGRNLVAPDVDAVLLTHAHADHVDYISFLHEKIPIYMGSTCHMLLQAIQDRSNSDFEREVLEYKPVNSKRGDPKIHRKIETFRSGKKFKIDSLEVHPIHVDHSVPGAYGFIIYTSEGPVVYTGDIRLHGTKYQMTEEFVRESKAAKPVALICEGTRITDEPTNESEERVYKESNKLISKTDNLIFADFNFKDIDRVRTFYDAAKANGRKLVVKIRDCHYLKHLSKDPNLNVPNFDDENIVIYKPKYRSGTYADSDYTGDDAFFASQPNAKTASEISTNADKYLCALGYFQFTSLIDMKLKNGTVYIHSASEPYNEEQVIALDRVNTWLEHFGMKKYQIHCSGHAKGEDLLQVVKDIDAKMLYPIHTEHPTEYVKVTRKMTIVEEGKKYKL